MGGNFNTNPIKLLAIIKVLSGMVMTKHDINKAYVSPYDKFLFEFDATHEKSESQLKEIKKHQRIAALRDNDTPDNGAKEVWKDF